MAGFLLCAFLLTFCLVSGLVSSRQEVILGYFLSLVELKRDFEVLSPMISATAGSVYFSGRTVLGYFAYCKAC